MAVYNLDVKIIARSAGKSVVATAAYRSGERLFDERQGKSHDYTNKRDIVGSEILTPDRILPDWAKDRGKLWNEVERVEKRKDAQLAREVMVSLPRELDQDKQIKLVRGFVVDQFVSKGMIADVSYHNPAASDGKGNPHAHILLTMRDVDGEGFGLKNRSWNTAIFTKDDRIKDKSELVGLRADWAQCVNGALDENGFNARVDHRSYADRGMGKNPVFMPAVALHMEGRGIETDIYRDCVHKRYENSVKEQSATLQQSNNLQRSLRIANHVSNEKHSKLFSPVIEAPPIAPPFSYAEYISRKNPTINNEPKHDR